MGPNHDRSTGRSPGISRRTLVKGTAALAALGAGPGTLGLGRVGAQESHGGTLRIAFSDALTQDTLNPALQQPTFFLPPPQGALYESLVRLDNDFQPNPHLAESWEPEADAAAWVFRLLPGVTFHDGSPLTAKDVVWSLRSAMDPQSGSNLYGQLKDLLKPENITADGDSVVRFKLERPFVFFPNPLGTRNSRIFKDGYTAADFAANPIGTGPFKFRSFVPGESFAADRFDGYWQDGKPLLDAIEIVNIPEAASKLEALLTGEVDLIDNIEYASSRVLEGTEFEPLPLPDAIWHGIICDTTVEPFTDPRVVQALKLAADRQQIVDIVYAGFASLAADSVIPVSDPNFPAAVQPRRRDVDAARRLLAEAGHDGGLEIPHPLTFVPASGTSNLAAVLKEQWAEAGITVSLREGGPTFWDTVWLKEPFYIPEFNRRHPSEIFPLISITDAGQWMTRWSDPAFDAAVVSGGQSTDPAVQRQQYGEAIRLQGEHDGIVLPAYAPRLHAKAKRVQGVLPNFVSFFDFTDATLA